MRKIQVLATAILTGSLLLGATACSSSETTAPNGIPAPGTTEAPSVSQSATPATESPTPAPTEDASTAILNTANEFYDFIASPAAGESVKSMSASFTGDEPTQADLETMVADHPEVFKYYDTSTPENIKNAVENFVLGATVASFASMAGEVNFTVPADAVSVDGDKGTVDVTAIEVTANGEVMDGESSSTQEANLNFVKKDGSWVIVASPVDAK